MTRLCNLFGGTFFGGVARGNNLIVRRLLTIYNNSKFKVLKNKSEIIGVRLLAFAVGTSVAMTVQIECGIKLHG
jgi:hypothetical protein